MFLCAPADAHFPFACETRPLSHGCFFKKFFFIYLYWYINAKVIKRIIEISLESKWWNLTSHHWLFVVLLKELRRSYEESTHPAIADHGLLSRKELQDILTEQPLTADKINFQRVEFFLKGIHIHPLEQKSKGYFRTLDMIVQLEDISSTPASRVKKM